MYGVFFHIGVVISNISLSESDKEEEDASKKIAKKKNFIEDEFTVKRRSSRVRLLLKNIKMFYIFK